MTAELEVAAGAEPFADASTLEEFWASNTWLMRKCPLGVGNGIIRFEGLTDQLSVELKIAIRAKFTNREWSVESKQAFLVNRIVSWLAANHSTTASLLDQPLEVWVHSFRRYLLDRGVLRQPIQQELTRTQEIRRWPLRDPAIVMLRSLYAKQLVLFRPAPPVPEFAKDVWDVRRMGVASGPVRSDHSLNFVKVTQLWLRLAAKHFIRHILVTGSYADAKAKLIALKRFSSYLAEAQPDCTPQAIDRPLILSFLAHMRTLAVAPATIGTWVGSIARILRVVCQRGLDRRPGATAHLPRGLSSP